MMLEGRINLKTVIMAGGKGTRIAELFPDIPKPLIPISNSDGVKKPVLEWEIESLASQGFTDIIITVSYRSDQIISYFGNGEQLGVNIEYFVEETPLGNAGALLKMRDKLNDDFLLLNADTVFDVDFNRFYSWHREKGALVSLFTHPNSHPYDSGLIISSPDGEVLQWLNKEEIRLQYYKNRVNAGLHIINPTIFDLSSIDAECVGKEGPNGKTFKVDLDRMLLKPLCGTGKMFCYDSPEYIKDMGTSTRFQQVSEDFKNGVVKSKNLRNKQKAIFLDRDGTINVYKGFLRNIDEFELIDGVAEGIRKINSSCYLCVVCTNQPVIARGEVTRKGLEEIHNKMETVLSRAGAYIDRLYYCPHHPNSGFPNEVNELKIECSCRKPKHGMLLAAAEDMNIELESSWMIGDSENDVKAGKAAQAKTILISSSEDNPAGADFIVGSLLEAVELILGK